MQICNFCKKWCLAVYQTATHLARSIYPPWRLEAIPPFPLPSPLPLPIPSTPPSLSAPPAPFPIPHPAFNFTTFGPTFTTSGQGKAYIIHLSFVKCNGALSDSQPKLIRIGDFVSLTTMKEHSEPNMGGHRWEREGQLEQRRGGGGLSQLAPWGLGKGKQHLQHKLLYIAYDWF